MLLEIPSLAKCLNTHCMHLLVNDFEIPNPVQHIHDGSGLVPFLPDLIVGHQVNGWNTDGMKNIPSGMVKQKLWVLL